MKKNVPLMCRQMWSGIIIFSFLSFLAGTGFASAAPEAGKPQPLCRFNRKRAPSSSAFKGGVAILDFVTDNIPTAAPAPSIPPIRKCWKTFNSCPGMAISA